MHRQLLAYSWRIWDLIIDEKRFNVNNRSWAAKRCWCCPLDIVTLSLFKRNKRFNFKFNFALPNGSVMQQSPEGQARFNQSINQSQSTNLYINALSLKTGRIRGEGHRQVVTVSIKSVYSRVIGLLVILYSASSSQLTDMCNAPYEKNWTQDWCGTPEQPEHQLKSICWC